MTGWGSGGINLTPDETNLTVEIPEIEVQGAVVESFVELLIELNTAPAIGIGGARDFVQLLFFCEFVGEGLFQKHRRTAACEARFRVPDRPG